MSAALFYEVMRMDKHDYDEIKRDINIFVRKEFGYKVVEGRIARKCSSFPTYAISGNKVDPYIRFAKPSYNSVHPGTIVISSRNVYPERKAQARKVVDFLYALAKKYRFEYIGLESTNDDSIVFGP